MVELNLDIVKAVEKEYQYAIERGTSIDIFSTRCKHPSVWRCDTVEDPEAIIKHCTEVLLSGGYFAWSGTVPSLRLRFFPQRLEHGSERIGGAALSLAISGELPLTAGCEVRILHAIARLRCRIEALQLYSEGTGAGTLGSLRGSTVDMGEF